jgi:hypothetical protein
VRVLLLADSCNPDWPSLPIVGYKLALAIANHADVTLVTQVRNRAYCEKARARPLLFFWTLSALRHPCTS